MNVNTSFPLRLHPGWLRRAFFICGVAGFVSGSVHAGDAWVDVSSHWLERLTNNGVKLDWPGGCSGVVANRLTGEVTIKVVGCGLWSSSDKGKTWKRVDGDTVSGRDETGWATSVDQNIPARMASFSLDGLAGWTRDGRNWESFAGLGRNWDFGSVDWTPSEPRTIIAAKHETNPPGEVYASTNGGASWKQLAIHLNENRERISMIGALGAMTFIYGKGEGIDRSIDGGASWAKVSDANPQTRIPGFFRGAHYLGTATGLLVSKDLGASWQPRGGSVNIWQGPYFGRDEKEMAVIGKEGLFMSRNGGETWTCVAGLKPNERNFSFGPNWFGCYAWDPVNRVLYASSMGNAIYTLQL